MDSHEIKKKKFVIAQSHYIIQVPKLLWLTQSFILRLLFVSVVVFFYHICSINKNKSYSSPHQWKYTRSHKLVIDDANKIQLMRILPQADFFFLLYFSMDEIPAQERQPNSACYRCYVALSLPFCGCKYIPTSSWCASDRAKLRTIIHSLLNNFYSSPFVFTHSTMAQRYEPFER